MASAKKFNVAILAGLVPALFVIIGIIVFLSSSDGYGDYPEKTGWQALQLQWPSFWIWAALGFLGACVCAFLVYRNESGTAKGWLQTWLRGKTGTTIALVIIGVCMLTGPWGRACTDKTNSGITAPGYKNENKADSVVVTTNNIWESSKGKIVYRQKDTTIGKLKAKAGYFDGITYTFTDFRYAGLYHRINSFNINYGENREFVKLLVTGFGLEELDFKIRYFSKTSDREINTSDFEVYDLRIKGLLL